MRTEQTYYLYQALIRIGVIATVTAYAPFLLSLGLSLGEIALVNAVYWGVVILAEIPTGMLADGRGRAWSLKAAAITFSIGAVIYFVAQGLYTAMLGEAVIGVGSALLSGAGQAWIADALAREKREHELKNIYATNAIVVGLVSVFVGMAGSIIASAGYRFIWVPMIITGLIAWLLAHLRMNGKGESLDPLTEIQALRRSLIALRQNSALRWMLAAVILLGFVVPFNHYWAPYFQEMLGLSGLAVLWAIMYGSLVAAGWFVRRLTIQVGHEGRWVVVALLLVGVGLLLIPVFGSALFVFAPIVLHEFGRGMFVPLADSYVQHRVQSGYRATYGSLQSFIGNFGFMIMSLLVWVFVGDASATVGVIGCVWIIAGFLVTTGAAVIWLFRPRA